MGTTKTDSRRTELARRILEEVDRWGSVAGDLLFARLESKFGGLDGQEYSAVMGELRELGLIESFDGGYDVIHEITRAGVARLIE